MRKEFISITLQQLQREATSHVFFSDQKSEKMHDFRLDSD